MSFSENRGAVRNSPQRIPACRAPFMTARQPFENLAQPIGPATAGIDPVKQMKILACVSPLQQLLISPACGRISRRNTKMIVRGRAYVAVKTARHSRLHLFRNGVAEYRGK